MGENGIYSWSWRERGRKGRKLGNRNCRFREGKGKKKRYWNRKGEKRG